MDNEIPESAHHPVVTVEAAPFAATSAPDWIAPAGPAAPLVVPRAYCPHRYRFRDLRARGRLGVVGAKIAIAVNWFFVFVGIFGGMGVLIGGLTDADRPEAFAGFVMISGAVLLAVGNVALAHALEWLHRPNDVVIVLSSIGFMLFLVGTVLFVLRAEVLGLMLFALPGAFVTGTLWWFRSALYDRRTCHTHPGFSPAIRAMFKQDPGYFAAAVAPGGRRSWIEACPHRVRFRDLRGRYQVLSIVNSVLYCLYFSAAGVCSVMVLDRKAGGVAAALAIAWLTLHLQVPALIELHLRSKRYHRAPLGLYPAAFAAYGLVAAVSIWMAVLDGNPAVLGLAALALYYGSLAVNAMKKLPPRSACRALPDLLPEVERLLKPDRKILNG